MGNEGHFPQTLHLCLRLLQTFISNMKFDVEFTINRYPLRLQHRAVDLVAKHQLEEVLFPSGAAAANLSMPKLRSGTSAQNAHRWKVLITTLKNSYLMCREVVLPQ